MYVVDAPPGDPAIEVLRFGDPGTHLPGVHSHAGLGIAYFDADGGSLTAGGGLWSLRQGDLVVVAPGHVYDATGLSSASGWGVFFPPDSVDPSRFGLLTWRASPMLRPFVSDPNPEPRRFQVAEVDRPWWSAACAGLAAELRDRRPGYREASAAHLALLLVAVGRLGEDVPQALAINDEPLLAQVFDYIERTFDDGASLRDVARAVHLTPGHLTTVVRRKTGRTVQAWIIERRMAEGRKLLTATDLTVDEVAVRAGFTDTPYFVRSFRRVHSTTPLAWRRAARAAPPVAPSATGGVR